MACKLVLQDTDPFRKVHQFVLLQRRHSGYTLSERCELLCGLLYSGQIRWCLPWCGGAEEGSPLQVQLHVERDVQRHERSDSHLLQHRVLQARLPVRAGVRGRPDAFQGPRLHPKQNNDNYLSLLGQSLHYNRERSV